MSSRPKKTTAERGGRASHPETRVEEAVLRAQLQDAQCDVRLWLAAKSSEEERVYVREIGQRLAALERTVDHRIHGLASDDEEGRWDENAHAFLEQFQKAREVRGRAVGQHLSRLAALFEERTATTNTAAGNSREAAPEIPAATSTDVPPAKASPQAESSAAAGRDRKQDNAEQSELTPKSWQELEIAFVSDNRVEICSGGSRKSYNYDELGFVDRRSWIPNRAWKMLCEIARKNGTIQLPRPLVGTGKERAMIQKRIEEIRERLRSHFGIEADPIPCNGSIYQASFKISRRPSFKT